MRRGGSRWVGAAVAAVLALVSSSLSSVGAAQTIGAVDFAVRPPMPSISGLFPGRFAADDVTTLLERDTHAPLVVISRQTMAQAQTALGWRETDMTKYARLSALAERAQATYLAIGTIDRLALERQTNSSYRATATVHIQVFTLVPARITGAVAGSGSAVASTSRTAAQQALHQAIEQALPSALAKIAPTR